MNGDRIPLSEVIATLKPIVANIAENYSFPSFITRKISFENFDILIITWRSKLGYLQVDYLFALRPRYDASFRRVRFIDDELFVSHEYPLKQECVSELINLIKRLSHLIMLDEI